MEILTDVQFKQKVNQLYHEEKEKIITKQKWNKLSKNEKKIVLEIYNVLYPNKKININEARWYNTVMDVLGMLPVVGTPIDLYNGYSYWRQGDILFAILSWISAVPLIGDILGGVLKPTFNLIKVGGKGVNLLKAAILAKDAAKIAETAKNVGGPVVKILEKAPFWGEKVIKMLEQTAKYIPFLGGGFVNTAKSWLEIFGLAGKELKTFESLGRPAVRKLMGNTKWYMGWLDWYGLTDFKGTEDELRKIVPDLDTKVAQYASTPESKNILAQSSDTEPITPPQVTSPPSPPHSSRVDPIELLMKLI